MSDGNEFDFESNTIKEDRFWMDPDEDPCESIRLSMEDISGASLVRTIASDSTGVAASEYDWKVLGDKERVVWYVNTVGFDTFHFVVVPLAEKTFIDFEVDCW